MPSMVTVPSVDSRATAPFEAVHVISGWRTRLREFRLPPDGRLALVGGRRTVVAEAPLGVTLPMVSFPECCGSTSISLYSSIPHFRLACCALYCVVIVLATPNSGFLMQPWVPYFLMQTLTIPYGACCAQYSTVLYLPLRTTAA